MHVFQHTLFLEDQAAEQPLSPELDTLLSAGEKPVVFTLGGANIQARRFFDPSFRAIESRRVRIMRPLQSLPAFAADSKGQRLVAPAQTK